MSSCCPCLEDDIEEEEQDCEEPDEQELSDEQIGIAYYICLFRKK
jgi:hypothetical protein